MHSHNKEIQQKYVSSLEGTTFEKYLYFAIFDFHAHRKYIASPELIGVKVVSRETSSETDLEC